VNMKEATDHGRTAIILGCLSGHKKVVERLLLAGANANLPCQMHGNTALHYLAQMNDQDMANELVELLLPFTQPSLIALNFEGHLPLDLAQDSTLKALLTPKEFSLDNSISSSMQCSSIREGHPALTMTSKEPRRHVP